MKWGWVLPVAERVIDALAERKRRKQAERDMTESVEMVETACRGCERYILAPVDEPAYCPRCIEKRKAR